MSNTTVGKIVFHNSNGVNTTINNNSPGQHAFWHNGNLGTATKNSNTMMSVNANTGLSVNGDAAIAGKLSVDVIMTKLHEENVRLNSVLEAMVLLMIKKGIIKDMQEFNDIVKAIDITNELLEDQK